MTIADELRKKGLVRTSPYTSGANAYNAVQSDPVTDLVGDLGDGFNAVKDFTIGGGQKAYEAAADSVGKIGKGLQGFGTDFSESIQGAIDPTRPQQKGDPMARMLGHAGNLMGGVGGLIASPVTGVIQEGIDRTLSQEQKQGISQAVTGATNFTKGGIRDVSKSFGLSDDVSNEIANSAVDFASGFTDMAFVPGAAILAKNAKKIGGSLLNKVGSVVDGINTSTTGKFANALSKYTGKSPEVFSNYGFIDYMNIVNNNKPILARAAELKTAGFEGIGQSMRNTMNRASASMVTGMSDMVGMNRTISNAMSSMLGDAVKNKYGWNRYSAESTRGVLESFSQRNVFNNVTPVVKKLSDDVSDAFGKFTSPLGSKPLKTQINNVFKDIQEYKKNFYESVSTTVGRGIPSMWDKTMEAASAGLANIDNPKFIGKLSEIVEGVSSMIGRNGTLEDQLSAMKRIDEALLNPDASVKSNSVYLRTLRDSLASDLEDAIGTMSPQAGSVLDAINDGYSQIRDTIQGSVQSMMQKNATAKEIEEVLNSDPEIFHEVMKSFDPSTRQSVMDQLRDSTSNSFKSKVEDMAEASGVRNTFANAYKTVEAGVVDVARDIEAAIVEKMDMDKVIAYAARGDNKAFDILSRITGTRDTKDLVRIMQTEDTDMLDMITEMTDSRKLQYGMRQAEIEVPPEAVPGRVVMRIGEEADKILDNLKASKERVIAENAENAVNKNIFKSSVIASFNKYGVKVQDGGIDVLGFEGRGSKSQTNAVNEIFGEYQRIIDMEGVSVGDVLEFNNFVKVKLQDLSLTKISKNSPLFGLETDIKTSLSNIIDDALSTQFVSVSSAGSKINVSWNQVNKDMADLISVKQDIEMSAGIKSKADRMTSKNLKEMDAQKYTDAEATIVGQYLTKLSSKDNAKIQKQVSKLMDYSSKYGIIQNKRIINELISHLRWLDEILPTDAITIGSKGRLTTDGPSILSEIGEGALAGKQKIPVVGGILGAAGTVVTSVGKRLSGSKPTDKLDTVSKISTEKAKVLRSKPKE